MYDVNPDIVVETAPVVEPAGPADQPLVDHLWVDLGGEG